MALADVESVCTYNVVLSDSFDYCRKFDMPSDSAVPLPIAYSSASPELVAMELCVFEKWWIVHPSTCTTAPLVYFLVLWQPAQSLST